MPFQRSVLVLMACCLMFAAPDRARGEWFADLFVGGAWTDDENIDVKNPEKFSFKEDFDDSFTVGYRVGHWFDKLPFIGLALDLSYFSADPDFDGFSLDRSESLSADLWLVPLSVLVMARIPIMTSPDYPMGKFQIYGGAGPGFFYSDVEVEEFDDNSVDVGFDGRAGFAWMFSEQFALQFEFRYTNVDPEWEDHISGVKTEFETELETYHGLVGVSYRF